MRGERSRVLRALRSLLRALSRGLDTDRCLGAFDPEGRRPASQRAHALLLECLTPAQRRDFERTRGFVVQGASGRLYRIGFGTVANIEVLGERGEVAYRLCARPDDLPTAAVMLAQKLMLETREAEFLALAARHPFVVPAPRGESLSFT